MGQHPATEVANQRAFQLLTSHLKPLQLMSLKKRGHFTVQGSYTGCTWRILVGIESRSHNVMYEDTYGRFAQFSLCAWYNNFQIPFCDQVLAQKMLLETDEIEFMAIAHQAGIVPKALVKVFKGPVRQRQRERYMGLAYKPYLGPSRWQRLCEWLKRDY